jgi:ABC-2 type transport system ATP-binding protein
MPAAVSVTGLRKRYGAVEALRGVSFDVPAGRIFGLLGPNGAGKTTALECILGLRAPDAGSVRIHGHPPAQAKSLVGAQLQAAALQDTITPRQALDLFGSFYAQPFSSGEMLARFDLEPQADAAFATLSGGQRQRLFLALALVHRPAVLVLDEPTAGLDPRARRGLRELIREIRAEGRTVLLSTHDLDEAAEHCDEVAILDAGRILAVAPPGEWIARAAAPARLVVRTSPPLPSLANAVRDGNAWILETRDPTRSLADLVRAIEAAGAELLDIEFRRPTLEDVFLESTGETS